MPTKIIGGIAMSENKILNVYSEIIDLEDVLNKLNSWENGLEFSRGLLLIKQSRSGKIQ